MAKGSLRIFQDIAIAGDVNIDLEHLETAGPLGGRMTLYATAELTDALRVTLKGGSRDGVSRAHVNVVAVAGRVDVPTDLVGSVVALPGERFTLRVVNHNAAACEIYGLVVFE